MKNTVTYRDVAEHAPVQRELQRQTAKLDRQLKKFDPDLVDLHVSVERRSQPQHPFAASVTLYLPSAQLHASEQGPLPVVALKHAAAELMRELKKFKAKLRGDHKRRQASRRSRRSSF